MKKEYHGKAIYQPSGKAAEYGEWAFILAVQIGATIVTAQKLCNLVCGVL